MVARRVKIEWECFDCSPVIPKSLAAWAAPLRQPRFSVRAGVALDGVSYHWEAGITTAPNAKNAHHF